jgi:uncharacterized surface protein with fasciclin (FAS1) repeats
MSRKVALLISVGCLLWCRPDLLVAGSPDRGQLRKFLIPRDYEAAQVLDGWAEEGDLLQCYRPYVVHPEYYVRDIKVTLRGDSVSSVTVVRTTDPQAGVGVGQISAFLFAEKEGISSAKFLPVVGLPEGAAKGMPQRPKAVGYRFLITKPGEKQELCDADKITYRAWRVGETVYLSARGVHRTSGFRVLFDKQQEPGHPPTFRLMHIRPTGAVSQPLTPFEICTAYEESISMRSVKVLDAHDEHAVAIHEPGMREEEPPRAEGNIVGTATAEGSFEMFLELAEKADLAWVLKTNGPFTVLAPTDEAFKKLPRRVLKDLVASETKLRIVLSYHIYSRGMSNGMTAEQLFQARSIQTWGGQVFMFPREQALGLNQDERAKLVKKDLLASNGVLHGLDAVLMPPFGE